MDEGLDSGPILFPRELAVRKGMDYSAVRVALYRLALMTGVACLVGLPVLAAGIVRSNYVTGVGIAPAQPLPFSHKHHSGELGIQCRYCHTTVDREATAGSRAGPGGAEDPARRRNASADWCAPSRTPSCCLGRSSPWSRAPRAPRGAVRRPT